MLGRRLLAAAVVPSCALMLAGCYTAARRAVSARKQAKRVLTQARIKQITVALELFKVHLGRYPTEAEGLDALVEAPEEGPLADTWRAGGPFLPDRGLLKDAWGSPLKYKLVDQPQAQVRVWSIGPDKKDGTGDDIGAGGSPIPPT